MLLEEEITALIEEKIRVLKEHTKAVPDIANRRKTFDKDDLPEYTPIYRDSVNLARKIAIHSTIETFPDTLFKLKAPNESQEQWDYRMANYRPKTKAAWSRAVGSAARIWNEQNWSLIFEDDDSIFKDELSAESYFTKSYPEFKSITTFFKSVVHKHKFDDPNILVCNKPRKLPEDQSELIEPITVLYRSDQVIEFNERVAMILLDEKSLVKIGGKLVRQGIMWELYDDTNIYIIQQVGDKQDLKFEFFVWYEHNLEFLPCVKLKGVPAKKVEKSMLYESHFNNAVPDLDEALYDHSNLQLSKTGHAFPQRVEVAERCDTCDGTGYTIHDDDAKSEITCRSCQGTGGAGRQSVLGVSKWIKAERLEGAGSEMPFPGVEYVEPGTGIYEFLDKQIDKAIAQAFMMMNIDVSDTARTGSSLDESATKSKINREELFAFLEGINDQEFMLFAFCIETQGRIRYAERWNSFVLKKPTEFAIRDSFELTEEIVAAKNAMLPTSILTNLNIQFANIRFATNDKQKKVVKLQGKMDSLMYNSVTEINSMVGSGRIASWKATMHIEWNQIIVTLVEQNADFLTLPFEQQQPLIVTESQRRDLENKPPVVNSAEEFENRLANVGA